jgi:hypothetical protein
MIGSAIDLYSRPLRSSLLSNSPHCHYAIAVQLCQLAVNFYFLGGWVESVSPVRTESYCANLSRDIIPKLELLHNDLFLEQHVTDTCNTCWCYPNTRAASCRRIKCSIDTKPAGYWTQLVHSLWRSVGRVCSKIIIKLAVREIYRKGASYVT